MTSALATARPQSNPFDHCQTQTLKIFTSQPIRLFMHTQPRNPDVFLALKGFYAAHREQDEFRLESWLRHLELIAYFQRLNTGFPGGSEIPERGSGRRG